MFMLRNPCICNGPSLCRISLLAPDQKQNHVDISVHTTVCTVLAGAHKLRHILHQALSHSATAAPSKKWKVNSTSLVEILSILVTVPIDSTSTQRLYRTKSIQGAAVKVAQVQALSTKFLNTPEQSDECARRKDRDNDNECGATQNCMLKSRMCPREYRKCLNQSSPEIWMHDSSTRLAFR